MLRTQFVGQPHRMSRVWGREVGGRRHDALQHYTVRTLYVESDPGGHEDDDDPEYDVLHVCSYRPGGW